MKTTKNRKGFTLAELCIVLAISVIVVALILSTMLIFSSRNKKISDEAAFIGEVTVIQNFVNEWKKNYDSNAYSIEGLSDNSGLRVFKRNTEGIVPEGSTPMATLIFDAAKGIVVANDTTDSSKNTQTKGFNYVTKISFYMDSPNIVRTVLMRTDKNDDDLFTQTLLFPLMTSTNRERGITGRNK